MLHKTRRDKPGHIFHPPPREWEMLLQRSRLSCGDGGGGGGGGGGPTHVAVIKPWGVPDAKWLISSWDSLVAGGPRVAALSEVSRKNCSWVSLTEPRQWKCFVVWKFSPKTKKREKSRVLLLILDFSISATSYPTKRCNQHKSLLVAAWEHGRKKISALEVNPHDKVEK